MSASSASASAATNPSTTRSHPEEANNNNILTLVNGEEILLPQVLSRYRHECKSYLITFNLKNGHYITVNHLNVNHFTTQVC